MKARLAAVGLLPVLALVACGGSSAKFSEPAKQYLAAVSALNQAHDEFNKTNDDLDNKNAPTKDYVPPIKTFVAAIRAFDATMASVPWPAAAEADVKALTDSDAKFVEAMDAFATAAIGTAPADFEGLGSAMNSAAYDAAAAALVVEKDVGIAASRPSA